jgi:hypothetical protein
MQEDWTQPRCSGGELRQDATNHGRALSHDEAKAAEAAFRGAPFNPAWSSAAGRVYLGILAAMEKRQPAANVDIDRESAEIDAAPAPALHR